MLAPTHLHIMDVAGQPMANHFWSMDDPNGWLAILLPGLRYSSDMPLLYYPRLLLQQRNVTVLNLNPNTQSKVFQNATRDDQLS